MEDTRRLREVIAFVSGHNLEPHVGGEWNDDTYTKIVRYVEKEKKGHPDRLFYEFGQTEKNSYWRVGKRTLKPLGFEWENNKNGVDGWIPFENEKGNNKKRG